MKISKIALHVISIPMRVSVKHALAERQVATNLLVEIAAENGLAGWGECCPRTYVTGEDIESVIQTLSTHWTTDLRQQEWDSFDDVVTTLSTLGEGLPRNQLSAFCALELAVLDLAGQTFGQSAGSAIGPVAIPSIRYSGVIATDDLAQVQKMCTLMAQAGFQQVKVKLTADLEQNQAVLQSARSILGETVELRGDANCAWTGDEAIRQLEQLASFQLAGIEQPVPGDDIAGMTQVTQSGLVPVVADESVCSYRDGEALVEAGACNIFNLRVSKCGGLINTMRLYQLARKAGLSCQLGAQVGEFGLLSAAGRHIATRLADIRWFEGSFGLLLLEDEVFSPDMTFGAGGKANSLNTPGIGVRPITEKIQALSQTVTNL